MKTTSGFLGAVVVLSLLAGNAQSQGKVPAKPAKAEGQDYRTLIRNASPLKAIVTCTADPGGSCRLKVDADEKCSGKPTVDNPLVHVGPGVHIIWTLNSGTWEFDSENGISFKDGAAPFEGKMRPAPKVFQWRSKSDAAGKGYFAYNIRLKNKDGKTCEIDPGLWV